MATCTQTAGSQVARSVVMIAASDVVATLAASQLEMRLNGVVALTNTGGLGLENRLPWHPRRLQLDLAFLRYATTHVSRLAHPAHGQSVAVVFDPIEHPSAPPPAVIYGRKTWDSLPPRHRPLPDRFNIVVSGNPHFVLYNCFSQRSTVLPPHPLISIVYSANLGGDPKSATTAPSLQAAIEVARPYDNVYILGGAGIYAEAVKRQDFELLFVTQLLQHPEFPCNVHFPLELLREFNVLNISEMVYALLRDTLPRPEAVTCNGLAGHPDFAIIEGDVTYKILCYFKQ